MIISEARLFKRIVIKCIYDIYLTIKEYFEINTLQFNFFVNFSIKTNCDEEIRFTHAMKFLHYLKIFKFVN